MIRFVIIKTLGAVDLSRVKFVLESLTALVQGTKYD